MRLAALWLLATCALLAGRARAETPNKTVPAAEWRLLGRGVASRETRLVRASWLRRDSVSRESTYVGYRIEDARGRLWASDTLPGHWCEGTGCWVEPWRRGLWFSLSFSCFPCYPDACEETQYAYVAAPDTAARSPWGSGIRWWVSDGGRASQRIEESGISWELPLRPVVDRHVIRFEFAPPPEAGDGRPFRVEASGHAFMPSDPNPARVAITLYPTAAARSGRLIEWEMPAFSQVLSAQVRAEQGANGAVRTELLRVEVRLGEARGFISPDELAKLGWQEP